MGPRQKREDAPIRTSKREEEEEDKKKTKIRRRGGRRRRSRLQAGRLAPDPRVRRGVVRGGERGVEAKEAGP